MTDGSQAGGSSAARLALQATKEARWGDAAAIVGGLIEEQFALAVTDVTISRDQYSLNSVNGFVATADGREFFFKFHHEDGEEQTLQEFYRGELLQAAGYPVDMPLFVSRDVGRQILLYARRRTPRFADVCRDCELLPAAEIGAVVAAQAQLDAATSAIYRRTWHPIDARRCEAEPIHQLFYRRLVAPHRPDVLGGRAAQFFWGAEFRLAGITLSAEQLRAARWCIDGRPYRDSLGELLERSRQVLDPAKLAGFGGVVAHGDAHNANVWWNPDSAPALSFFDPAFAGEHVPALLAEVKATFHNCLAHPLWLYDAEEASRRYAPTARFVDGTLEVSLDWLPSPLRQAFLDLKAERVWRPLLAELASRGTLDAGWRKTVRSALFCCPALVMSMRAGDSSGHTPTSSLIGLSVAVMAGSEPAADHGDFMTRFFDSIDPHPCRMAP